MTAKEMEGRPQWAQEKQTDPPNFGKAKRIPRWLLNFWVWRRRRRVKEILAENGTTSRYEKGMISLVVLSCKRLPELRRLCESMSRFFREIEHYPRMEKILVDNGSGPELLGYVRGLGLFDRVIAHDRNLGMAGALNDAYQQCRGEFIMLVEDDMIVDYERPFLKGCVDLFREYPEIGIIRLKNQNNWWKPCRIIGPLRKTTSGVEFWTWFPSLNREYNVWACGSVIFRKVSFFNTGLLPRGEGRNQAILVENVYGRKYNRTWLAAKIRNCYPIFQPNDNLESPGFEDKLIDAPR